MAVQQLALAVGDTNRWRLDTRTIERGKKGVKDAREALQASVARAEARRSKSLSGETHQAA